MRETKEKYETGEVQRGKALVAFERCGADPAIMWESLPSL